MTATPSTAAVLEAEKLLPCENKLCRPMAGHSYFCPAPYRPAVAAALDAKDAENAAKDATILTLRSALEPFAVEADIWDFIADSDATRTITKHPAITVSHLRKARTALQTTEQEKT